MKRRRDDGMTLVELLIAMTLSVVLVAVLVSTLTLVLRVAIGESSESTQVGGQNANFIPAQLQANAGAQQVARTFSADVANILDATQVTSPLTATNPTCGRPSSDPKLSGTENGIVRLSLTDSSGHEIDYRYSRDSRNTEGRLVRYECVSGTPTARVLAMGLSSKTSEIPTFATSGSGKIKTFTLTLTNISKRVYTFDATMRADITATLAPVATQSPDPLLTSATAVKMLDADTDGKVDAVAVTFGTASVTGCITGWTLGGTIPSGGTQGLLNTTSGSTVTIPITEGSGAADTSVGTLTVTYTPSVVCSTRLAPMAAVAPTDAARPVVTALTATTGGTTAGKIEATDTFAVTFSEPLLASTIPSDVTITETGGNNGNTPDKIQIAGGSGASSGKHLTQATLNLQATSGGTYITQNNRTATFSGTVTASGSTITVTIPSTATCSGNGCAQTGAGIGTFTFVPSTTLTDAAANTAAPGAAVANWRMF